MSDEQSILPRRIQIPGDTLIPDQEWCDLQLGGATRRTSQRLDKDGCPYTYIRGEKWRPLNEGQRGSPAASNAATPQKRVVVALPLNAGERRHDPPR
jgi:hypothetical protein